MKIFLEDSEIQIQAAPETFEGRLIQDKSIQQMCATVYGVIQSQEEVTAKKNYRSIKYLEDLSTKTYKTTGGVVNCVALLNNWAVMTRGKHVGQLPMKELKAGKSF